MGAPVEALIAESLPDKLTPPGMERELANDLVVVDIMAMGLISHSQENI